MDVGVFHVLPFVGGASLQVCRLPLRSGVSRLEGPHYAEIKDHLEASVEDIEE